MEGVRQSNNTSKTQNESKKLEGNEKEMNIDDLDKRSAGKEDHFRKRRELPRAKREAILSGIAEKL